MAAKPKHFSMIREFHLADFFTLANAACGTAAIFLAMMYVASDSLAHFLAAAAMAPAAFIFDVFDGRVGSLDHVLVNDEGLCLVGSVSVGRNTTCV